MAPLNINTQKFQMRFGKDTSFIAWFNISGKQQSFLKKGEDCILKRFGTTVEVPISAETLHVLGFLCESV